ncbi:hypothetical protein KKC17_03825 [Patescibacteria group bacterium]|nr:hypothetical protein [Patescibacteria group bacterium]
MSKNNGYVSVSELDITELPKGRKFFLCVKASEKSIEFIVQVVEKNRLKICFNKATWIVKFEKVFLEQIIDIPDNIFSFSGKMMVVNILVKEKIRLIVKNVNDDDSNEENDKEENLAKIASYSYSNKPFNIHISHQNPFGGK